MDLAWLLSCVLWPPFLNLWTRIPLVHDPVGGSGIEMVNFGGVTRPWPSLCRGVRCVVFVGFDIVMYSSWLGYWVDDTVEG